MIMEGNPFFDYLNASLLEKEVRDIGYLGSGSNI